MEKRDEMQVLRLGQIYISLNVVASLSLNLAGGAGFALDYLFYPF